MLRLVLSSILLIAITACTGVQVEDYRDTSPVFEVEAFFNGTLVAHGVVQDRAGRVTRKFVATIDASWQGGEGTLVEDFVFDDGEQQRRIWTLTRSGPGSYVGTAGDVVGEARLQQAGSSVFLDYVLQVPYGDGTVDVRVDDRMYLVSPDVLINESDLRKFGFEVGRLLLTIRNTTGEAGP